MAEAANVLALDLASSSGFAHGPVGGRPFAGTIPLGDGGHGERGLALLRWLNTFLKVEQVSHAFVEKPLAPRVLVKIGATEKTALLLYGLPFLAQTVFASRGVWSVRLVNVQDVRAHFTGQRTFSAGFDPVRKKKTTPRDEGKAATMNCCRLRGWQPANHDEADAMALWSYGVATLDPRLAALATPLFGRVR